MKIYELREGDKFKSLNPEVTGSGLCIGHKIIDGNITDLAIIWEDIYQEIYDNHFMWNRDCELISQNNDVFKYQNTFKIKSKVLNT